MTNTKKAIICAIMIAMCVVLPMAFHAIPNAGSIYLPMHIPVLLCGLVTGWPYGLLCGIAGPIMSYLITAMPGIGYLPQMVIELAAYGLITGLLGCYFCEGFLFCDSLGYRFVCDWLTWYYYSNHLYSSYLFRIKEG